MDLRGSKNYGIGACKFNKIIYKSADEAKDNRKIYNCILILKIIAKARKNLWIRYNKSLNSSCHIFYINLDEIVFLVIIGVIKLDFL